MFIMSFSWLVDNSYLHHLLAVAPYQSTGQMVISTLMLKWHLKMNWVHLAHNKSSLQKWQRCIHWWERLCYRNFSFAEQPSVTVSAELQAYAVESATVTLCELLWRSKGSGKTPVEWKGCYEITVKAKGLLSDCSSCPPIAAVSAPGKAMPSFSWPKFSCCWLVNTTQNNPVSLVVDQPCVLYVLRLLAERHQRLSCPLHAAFTDRKLAFNSTGREAVHKAAAS